VKLDAYTFKARIAPAAITVLIPILVFNHFFASEEFRKLLGDILGLKLFSAITISSISLVFLAELSRAISKQLFQRVMFQDELQLPTTQFMLYKDPTYSEDFKNRFRSRVLKEFKVVLPTAAEEQAMEDDARKRIAEAVTAIRKKLHGNAFLLQHNIEYGAIRNSLGGAILAVILNVANIILFWRFVLNPFAVRISLCLIVAYCAWIAMGPWMVRIYGRSYARILYREYMK